MHARWKLWPHFVSSFGLSIWYSSKQIGHSSMVSRFFFFRSLSAKSSAGHVSFCGTLFVVIPRDPSLELLWVWVVDSFEGIWRFLGENETGRGGWSGAVYRVDARFLLTASVGTTEEGGARDKGTCSSIVLELSGIIGKQQQHQPILWMIKPSFGQFADQWVPKTFARILLPGKLLKFCVEQEKLGRIFQKKARKKKKNSGCEGRRLYQRDENQKPH